MLSSEWVQKMGAEAKVAAMASHILESRMYDGGSAVFLTSAVLGGIGLPQIKANLRQLSYSFVRTYAMFMADDGQKKQLPPEEVFAEIVAAVSIGLMRFTVENKIDFDATMKKAEAILAEKYGAR